MRGTGIAWMQCGGTNSKVKGNLLVFVLRGGKEAGQFVGGQLVGQCCSGNIGGHEANQASYQRRQSHLVVVQVDDAMSRTD